MTRPRVVQIGLGKVGAGFLCDLYHRSNLAIVGVDTPQAIAPFAGLHYDLTLCGPDDPTTVQVVFQAVHASADKEAIAQQIAHAAFVSLAVPEPFLDDPCDTIAQGLMARGDRPLNLLIALNRIGGANVVRQRIADKLPPDSKHLASETNLGCVQTAIARMCVTPFRGESYKELPVDDAAFVGPMPPVVGLERCDPFRAWELRKMFVHNMPHFVAGLLCVNAGIEHLDQITEPLETIAKGAMGEAAQAVRAEFPQLFAADTMGSHVESLWRRMINPALHDESIRVANDLERKLAHQDRMVGAAQLCIRHKIEPVNIIKGFHAALTITDHRVAGAEKIQAIQKDRGVEWALDQVCALRPYDPLWALLGARETW